MTISISERRIWNGRPIDVTAVRFPYDEDRLADFRREFPAARWDTLQKYWTIPGKTATARAAKFFARESPAELVVISRPVDGKAVIENFIGGRLIER